MAKIIDMQDKTGNALTTAPTTREPLILQKRIGATTFTVNVRFSESATETLEDKIRRLIQREAA